METGLQMQREDFMKKLRGYHFITVVGAACELELFQNLVGKELMLDQLSDLLTSDTRATSYLVNALVALDVLEKSSEGCYRIKRSLESFFDESHPLSVVAMILHQMNCMRSWSDLARAVKNGEPTEKRPSIRGEEQDRAAFIRAMHVVNTTAVDGVIASLGDIPYTHLLDVGCGPGTWSLAFLKAFPDRSVTLFDLPHAIKQAQERLSQTEHQPRVTYAEGDFYRNELPKGADLAWVSAIIHQHSRAENRKLFSKISRALSAGGMVAIRDFVMKPGHYEPAEGALFAINMLVNTESGGTFTFDEISEDLLASGFVSPEWRVKRNDMHSIVTARKG